MTKDEHIDYWVKSSKNDWITVQSLLQTGRYVHCLFFGHLYLEKLCKAVWVKNNDGNIPPKIHNLVKLILQSKIVFPADQLEYLLEVNKFQLEGRYPDYINNFSRICDLDYTNKNLSKISEIAKCLIEFLQ